MGAGVGAGVGGGGGRVGVGVVCVWGGGGEGGEGVISVCLWGACMDPHDSRCACIHTQYSPSASLPPGQLVRESCTLECSWRHYYYDYGST